MGLWLTAGPLQADEPSPLTTSTVRLVSMPFREGPVHFSTMEWEVLNATRDRTSEIFAEGTWLLLRKAREFLNPSLQRHLALSQTAAELLATPVERRGRLIEARAYFAAPQDVRARPNLPNLPGADEPVWEILLDDPDTGEMFLLLSPVPVPEAIMSEATAVRGTRPRVTIYGYFYKVARIPLPADPPFARDSNQGNPLRSYVVVVGYLEPGWPARAAAGDGTGAAALGSDGSSFGAEGALFAVLIALLVVWLFIRGRMSGGFNVLARKPSQPLPLHFRKSSNPDDPRFHQPIDLGPAPSTEDDSDRGVR